jgi:hypothetical protein
MKTLQSADDVTDLLDATESYLMIQRYHSDNPLEESNLNAAIDLVAIAREEVEKDCCLELLSTPGDEHGAYETLMEMERRLN